MKKFLAVAVALTALSSMAFASGLEIGAPVGAFYVKDVTGPAAGTKLCYRCRYGNRPTVSIFTRNVDTNVTSLINQIDGVVGKNQGKDMKAFVVLLTDEQAAAEKTLKEAAEKASVTHTPLTTFDGQTGPAPYKLAQDAEVTVMMWVDGKLKVNEAFKAGELTQEKVAGLVGKTSQILN